VAAIDDFEHRCFSGMGLQIPIHQLRRVVAWRVGLRQDSL